MKRTRLIRLKKLALVMTTGVAFSALSCVTAATDAFGTGLSLSGVTGLFGPASSAATGIGTGLDAIADILRFAGA